MKKIIIFVSCMLSSFLVMADCVNRNVDVTEMKPNGLYVDHGDGTITDKETGLMWQKCNLGLSGSDCLTGAADVFTWQAALAVANGNSGSNYTDWRLPNIKELFSIVAVSCFIPAINEAVFPNSISNINNYWTSSTQVNTLDALYVGFRDGITGSRLKNNNYNVRLVRNIK